MNFNTNNLFKYYKEVYQICLYGGTIYGILFGIREFKQMKRPYVNLIERILNHTMDGFLIGVCWPILLSFSPLLLYDIFMGKNEKDTEKKLENIK